MKSKRSNRIKNIDELPSEIKKLPEHAQHLYLKAHNEALEIYKDPSRRGGETSENIANKAGWDAVKEKFNKRGSTWKSKS